MRYESTMANSHHSFGSTFTRDEQGNRKPVQQLEQEELEQELHLHDLFERSQGHLNASIHMNNGSSYSNVSRLGLSSYNNHNSYSPEALVQQFNASVSAMGGSSRLDRSVAEFYLEMCAQDVDTAVSFFKEQQQGETSSSVAASASVAVGVSAAAQQQQQQEVPAARRRSLRTPPRRAYSHELPPPRRRDLTLDLPEPAVVTAPDVSHRSRDDRTVEQDFDRLCQAYNTGVPSTIPRRCSVATTTIAKVPFRGAQRRGSAAPILARSKSERRATVAVQPTRRRPQRSRSSQSHEADNRVVAKQCSMSMREMGYDYYQTDTASVTRPPTASRRRYDGYWEPPTRTNLPSNPAA